MADVNNTLPNILISGTSETDSITNRGQKSTIYGGDGSDTIINTRSGDHYSLAGSFAYINAGNGNDYIENLPWCDYCTVDGGDGDDTINGHSGTSKFIGGAGNDSIYCEGWIENSISGGEGNDTIFQTSNFDNCHNATINGEDGNDYIHNTGKTTTILGGDGSDTIINTLDGEYFSLSGHNSYVDGGNGNDYIENLGWCDFSTVNGGTGDDTILNLNWYCSIDGGDGDDSIYTGGGVHTISCGKGNDTINSTGADSYYVTFKYTSGDGNDIIYGFNETDTLQIGGTYSVVNNGSDVVVTVGDGKITLVGAASLTSINIETFDYTPSPDTPNTTPADTGKIIANNVAGSVDGTAYDDIVDNHASKVTIKGGDGNDKLTTLRKTTNVKLYGDACDDTLEAYNSTKVLLSGGTGNDLIYSSGSGNTVVGGAGNDTIEIDSATTQIQYASGNGNDIIEGFRADSTLKIGDGKGTYSSETVDDDVIITVGDGRITMLGAASLEKLNIAGTFQNATLTLTNDDNWNQTIDSIIKLVDATKREKVTKITGNELNNTILGGSAKDIINGDDGNDSLVGNGGDDSLFGGDGNDILTGNNGSDSLFGDNGDDSLYGGSGNDYISGGNGHDILDGGAGNDSLTGGDGDDTFVYTAGKDIITDYAAGEDFISLGAGITFAKITKATTYGSNALISLSAGNYISIIGGKGKELSFIDAKGTRMDTLIGGEVYTDDAAYNVTIKSATEFATAEERTKIIQITGNALANTILGGSGKNILRGGEGDDSLVGGKANDSLFGDDGEDTLYGGAGNDTLTGGKGDDLFIYTSGKDVITDYATGDIISLSAAAKSVKSSGKDAIITVGNNTLTVKNCRDKVMTVLINGKEDTIVADDCLIMTDADKEANGKDKWNYVLDDNIKFANATARTKVDKITGNVLNNTILGGSAKDIINGDDGNDSLVGNGGTDSIYGGNGEDTLSGGAGNDYLSGGDNEDILLGGTGEDTLWGEAGNDTLTGGAGKDAFIYKANEGNDIITDFSNDDFLLIQDMTDSYDVIKNAAYNAGDVTFKVGWTANALTLKNIGANATLNINGGTYRIRDGKIS